MKKITMAVSAALLGLAAQGAMAACSDIPRAQLQAAVNSVHSGDPDQVGGFGLNMWLTFVDETGKVCEVVTTGTPGATSGNNEWLGSRIISAQKANTANAFSLNGVAISSGDLYGPTQPGGSLFGLQHSNPVDASRAYGGSPNTFGQGSDYIKNKRIGGVNVFGGGLPVYKTVGGSTVKVGAIGVSGDTSCADHSFAWLSREYLITNAGLVDGPHTFEYLTPVSGDGVYDALGEHPVCGGPNGTSSVGWVF
jgi:hypothetical protein